MTFILNQSPLFTRSPKGTFNFNVMLPAHFHDVTYNHIWLKILQELTKNPARNTRATLKSKLRSMPNLTRVLHEYNTKESLILFMINS